MKFFLFLVLLLTGCGQAAQAPLSKQAANYLQATDALDLSQARLENPLGVTDATAFEIAYGAHQRQKFDFIRPNVSGVVPLVIYVHGGGFVRGDKSSFFSRSSRAEMARGYLADGFAIASVNYRFLHQTGDGVRASMQDVMRALQFMRFHADSLGVDRDKVLCHGQSAGAGTCLWLALRDDMAAPTSADPIAAQSTKVSGAVATATQSTYDVLRWKDEIFASYLDYPIIRSIPLGWYPGAERLLSFYGITTEDQLYTPDILAYRRDVDLLQHFDAEDPPLLISNSLPDEAPTSPNMMFHSPLHALALLEMAKGVGTDYAVVAKELGITERSHSGMPVTPVNFARFLLQ